MAKTHMLPFLVGGDRGVGAREKGYGRWERKEREAGVFRGQEARDHIDKTVKKI